MAETAKETGSLLLSGLACIQLLDLSGLLPLQLAVQPQVHHASMGSAQVLLGMALNVGYFLTSAS